MVASKNSGRVSRRRVWPVGAVSNTTCEKALYSSLLASWTTLEMATASSTPGGSDSNNSPAQGGGWGGAWTCFWPPLKDSQCSIKSNETTIAT